MCVVVVVFFFFFFFFFINSIYIYRFKKNDFSDSKESTTVYFNFVYPI